MPFSHRIPARLLSASNKMATVRKLPSGKWRAETYDHGERHSWTFDAKDKKEARQIAALGEAEEKAKANRGMTLAGAMSAYIETCKAQGYSPSTIREYTSRAKNSFPDLAEKRLDALNVQKIQSQLDERINSGKAIKTVRNEWFLLRAVLAFYMPSLDLRRIRIARKPKRAKIVFREGWAADVLRTARETWGGDDFYAYCLLTIFAGLRPSESYALRWEDVSGEIIGIDGTRSGTISVHAAEVRGVDGYTRKAPKTVAGNRLLSVPWALIDEIQRVRPRVNGRILSAKPTVINWRWNRVKRLLGLPEEMRFYDLRHFYATAVANSGASEEELAARMGHSTSAFSHSFYVELFEDRQAPVNAALFAASEAAISASKKQKKEETTHEITHEVSGI